MSNFLQISLITLGFQLSFFIFSQTELTRIQANRLASLPLKCLQQEYPNKLNQLLLDSTELLSPKTLHPAFYGCFDWHSSVHGHWSLVYLLNEFPTLENRAEILDKLAKNLSKENIQSEIDYFEKPHERSYERMYGWTWILKLQHELEKSTQPELTVLAQNLKPLTDLLIQRYIDFLPKLTNPQRVGTHSNTAFGLTFAFDYAVFSKNQQLKSAIETASLRYFQNDKNYDFIWEPSGTDFLSPGMEEIRLMSRVLPENQFLPWLKQFSPSLFSKKFSWEVAQVSDRTDGHLVHLDGLNFSRAWCLIELAKRFPKKFSHLEKIAETHLNFSMPSIVDGNYEGEHWLASFALHALETYNLK
jgi:hypothetical protein